jgi:hypothetical protein
MRRLIEQIVYTAAAADLFRLGFPKNNVTNNNYYYYCARPAAKHSPQSTGRPLDGLKGTLSVLPHWSQVISKRWRSPPAPRPPPPKLARRASRQVLQRFGWLRFFSA